jgi:hypothetical protein
MKSQIILRRRKTATRRRRWSDYTMRLIPTEYRIASIAICFCDLAEF